MAHLRCSVSVCLKASRQLSSNACLCVVLLFTTFAHPAHAQDGFTDLGLPNYGTFHGSNFDSVLLQTGNLHMHVPILSFPGRGRVLDTNYLYDTQQWTATFIPNPTQQYPHGGFYNVLANDDGSGWRLANPFNWKVLYTPSQGNCTYTDPNTGHQFQYPYNVFTNFRVVDPEGTSHPVGLRMITPVLCNNGGTSEAGPSTDGSGIWLQVPPGNGGVILTNWTVTLKDGTQAITSEDANGNLYGGFGGSALQIVDAPGITYTSPLGQTLPGPAYTTWTIQDSNGTSQVYRLDYTLVDYNTAFCSTFRQYPGQTCVEHTGIKLEPLTLTLPNGQRYQFNWINNSALELASLSLPSGGSIAYTYVARAQTPFPIAQNPQSNPVHMVVSSRTVNHDGLSDLWTYPNTGTVIDPLGNSETHSFTALRTSQGLTSSFSVETQAQYLLGNGTGATPLRTVNLDYAFDVDPTSSRPVNPRVIRETTTLNDTGQVSKSEADFESFTYNYHSSDTLGGGEVQVTGGRSNATEHREYDWAAGIPALMRRKDITYLHTNNPTYVNLNIVGKVASATVYDSTSNLCQGQSRPCSQTVYEYDNYSHTNQPMQASGAIQHDPARSTTYTTRGNLTAVSKWRNTDGAWLTTTSQYDDAGSVIGTTDPLGNTTTFGYADSWGNTACAPSGQTKAYPTSITNALNQITTKTYNSCTGTLASTTDANLQPTSTTYDMMGRIAQVNFPDAGQSTYSYQDTSSPVSSTRTTKITSALNKVETTLFDGLGRPSQTQLTSDPGGTTYTLTTYDALGRKAKVYNPTRCNPVTTNCGETTWGYTTYTYDALDQVTSVLQPDNSLVSTAYGGNCTTVTDEAGKARKSCVDGLGRMTGVWEDPSGLNYETDYQYDALGNLTNVTQKGNNAANARNRTFQYDSLSELTSAVNPESGTILYAYDADGNVITKTAPLPNQTGTSTVTTTNTFDKLNRLTAKSYKDGGTADPYTSTAQYGYDGVALTGCTIAPPADTDTYPIGRSTAMCDGSGGTSWVHDTMGRVKQERRSIGGTAATHYVDYTYNLNGSLSVLQTPPLKTLNYTYNSAGRATQLLDSTDGINFATNATYAPPGELTGLTLGSATGFTGFTVSNAYNVRLQPILLSATNSATSATIFSECFDFHLGVAITTPSQCALSAYPTGNNGNVYAVANMRDPTRTQSLTYDHLNRVVSGQSSGTQWGETFTVDAWGNMTNETAIPGKTIHEGLNTSAGTNNQLAGFGYDAAGNMTSNGSATYVYDAENRLVWTSGYRYMYDGAGQRVEKCAVANATTPCPTSGTTGTIYWRGTGSDTLAETALGGVEQEEYIFFNGQRIARRDVSSSGATIAVHYYFSDHLGSHGVVENATGTTCEQDIDYYPYGGVENDYCSGTSVPQNYKFTGKERDAESGLDNFIKRYHASSMGRFMSPDPIMIMKQKLTDPQQWNMYSYSRNNPLRFMDPTGMYATDCGSLGAKVCANRVKQIDAFQAKLAGSKNAQDQAIAKTLGTSKDTKNGVTIGFVKEFKDAEGKTLAGKTGNTSGLFAAGQSTPDGRPVADIRIDLKGSLSGNDLSATVEHEGSHATGRMDFVNSCSATGCSQNLNLTGRQSEQNAYGAEYRFWQSVGQEQQHPMIGSPDQINQFLNQHPDVYPRNTLDNLLFPSDL